MAQATVVTAPWPAAQPPACSACSHLGPICSQNTVITGPSKTQVPSSPVFTTGLWLPIHSKHLSLPPCHPSPRGSLLSLEYTTTAEVPTPGALEPAPGKLSPRHLLGWLLQPLQVAYSDNAPSPTPPQPPRLKYHPQPASPSLHFTPSHYRLPIWFPICIFPTKQSCTGTWIFICLLLCACTQEALNNSVKGMGPYLPPTPMPSTAPS